MAGWNKEYKQQKISRTMSVRNFWAVLAKLETKFIQPDVLEYIEIIIRDPKHRSRWLAYPDESGQTTPFGVSVMRDVPFCYCSDANDYFIIPLCGYCEN